ncbi:MAG: hypothetical protein DMF64_19240 [Acidobacteria bacterium]|nr:MAG: hypothetical protein DMF64_19240 [Acidobacteriota bacterium]
MYLFSPDCVVWTIQRGGCAGDEFRPQRRDLDGGAVPVVGDDDVSTGYGWERQRPSASVIIFIHAPLLT